MSFMNTNNSEYTYGTAASTSAAAACCTHLIMLGTVLSAVSFFLFPGVISRICILLLDALLVFTIMKHFQSA